MTAGGTRTETPTNLPLVLRWLEAFEAAMFACDLEALEGLIAADAMWRDLGSLTWTLRQAHDRSQILEILGAVLQETGPRNFELAADRPIPGPAPYQPELVEVFFTFETRVARARARATLETDASTGELVLKVLLSQLTSLRDHSPVWPKTDRFDITHPDIRWHEHRRAQTSYSGRDPQVLIVGGGHSGVMTAAHLSRLGVDALVIDRQPRVGDAWRVATSLFSCISRMECSISRS